MRSLFLICLFTAILQFSVFAQSDEFQKGINFANKGDFQSALINFQNSFKTNLSDKKNAQIHYNIGVCFYRLNQPNKAVKSFEQAIELFPKNEKVYYGLAMAQVDLKDFVNAESNFLKAIKLDEKNGEMWFDLALVLCEEQKIDEAIKAFQNALKFNTIAEKSAKNNIEILSKYDNKSTAKLIITEKK